MAFGYVCSLHLIYIWLGAYDVPLSFKSPAIIKTLYLRAAGHHRHAVSSFLFQIEDFVLKEEHVGSIAYLNLSYLTWSSSPLHLTTSETCLSVVIPIHCLHDSLGFSVLDDTLKHGSEMITVQAFFL